MRIHSLILWTVCFLIGCSAVSAAGTAKLERIVVTKDGKGFEGENSHKAFHPWGLNYGNDGRLMEDFWEKEWAVFAEDFKKMKAMGANVVRIHLQYGKFMLAADKPNAAAFKKLEDTLKLAEETGLYLDVTGLGCYRPADNPEWYQKMGETERWATQALFWRTVAKHCHKSSAVFCYDLMNEAVSPVDKRKAAEWMSGNLFGGFDFVQFIALDPAGRSREGIVQQWLEKMIEAIRKEDKRALITVGLLPWSRQWKHLSGFVPEKIATQVDFISVHIYPDQKNPEEAMDALKICSVGKPVVIEEIFPLSCSAKQLEIFMRDSKAIATGWVGHYDGNSLKELDLLEMEGKITPKQAAYRVWLQMFTRLASEFSE